MKKLFIGNKNYSSWSMRPWVLMRQAGIAFEEVRVRFDSFAADSSFKTTMAGITPVGKVPVLLDGAIAIWDTLAIAEYVAEQHPQAQLWPAAVADRAHARSICAEMHSGFTALRSHCPMNIEADLAEVGALRWRDQPALRADVMRITQMWERLLAQHGGPLLFGQFTIADAYFAPVCSRIQTYALPVPAHIRAYTERVCALPSVQDWIAQARLEHDFLDFAEPYRLQR